jgi:hypothetical protein
MHDEERAFAQLAAELVHALGRAAVAYDAAAAEIDEEWLRILLEDCAQERRRLATDLAHAAEAWRPVSAVTAAPVLLADILCARDQALSALGVYDAEVERCYGMVFAHQPGRRLGELLRRQHRTLTGSRGRIVELRRRDRVANGR